MDKRFVKYLLSGLLLLGLAGSEQLRAPIVPALAAEDIQAIEYYFGGYPDKSYQFELVQEARGQVRLSAKGFNGADLNVSQRVSQQTFSDIAELISQQQILKWQGYHEHDEEVADGFGFGLTIRLASGQAITASGHERYPENFAAGHQALSDYLLALAAKAAAVEQ